MLQKREEFLRKPLRTCLVITRVEHQKALKNLRMSGRDCIKKENLLMVFVHPVREYHRQVDIPDINGYSWKIRPFALSLPPMWDGRLPAIKRMQASSLSLRKRACWDTFSQIMNHLFISLARLNCISSPHYVKIPLCCARFFLMRPIVFWAKMPFYHAQFSQNMLHYAPHTKRLLFCHHVLDIKIV